MSFITLSCSDNVLFNMSAFQAIHVNLSKAVNQEYDKHGTSSIIKRSNKIISRRTEKQLIRGKQLCPSVISHKEFVGGENI